LLEPSFVGMYIGPSSSSKYVPGAVCPSLSSLLSLDINILVYFFVETKLCRNVHWTLLLLQICTIWLIDLCSYNNRTFQVAGMKAICKDDQLSQLLYGELEKAIKKQGDLMLNYMSNTIICSLTTGHLYIRHFLTMPTI